MFNPFPNLNSQVIKTLKRALQPVITDFSMAWNLGTGWTVHQIPSSLPPLFSGDRLVVYGVLKATEKANEVGGPMEVRLQGKTDNDGEADHMIRVTTPVTAHSCDTDVKAEVNVVLHRLAAKNFIQEKQDDLNESGKIGKESEEAKRCIISISKSANVVSKFTSFVAVVKDSHERVTGPLRKLYCGRRRRYRMTSMGYSCTISRDRDESFSRSRRSKNSVPQSKSKAKSKGFLSSLFGSSRKGKTGKQAALQPPQSSQSWKRKGSQSVLSVISLQKASGAWDLTDQLVSLCGTSRDALIKGCPKEIAANTGEGKLLWATALALVLLMGKFLDQKGEWEMIADKGQKWLKKNLPSTVTFDEVLESAAATMGVQVNP